MFYFFWKASKIGKHPFQDGGKRYSTYLCIKWRGYSLQQVSAKVTVAFSEFLHICNSIATPWILIWLMILGWSIAVAVEAKTKIHHITANLFSEFLAFVWKVSWSGIKQHRTLYSRSKGSKCMMVFNNVIFIWVLEAPVLSFITIHYNGQELYAFDVCISGVRYRSNRRPYCHDIRIARSSAKAGNLANCCRSLLISRPFVPKPFEEKNRISTIGCSRGPVVLGWPIKNRTKTDKVAECPVCSDRWK